MIDPPFAPRAVHSSYYFLVLALEVYGERAALPSLTTMYPSRRLGIQ